MTDNERRAHDLAVAVAVDLARVQREKASITGAREIGYDYYAAYIAAYREALANLNAEFPPAR